MLTCGQDSRQAGQEQTRRDRDEMRLWWGRRGDDGGSSGGDSKARRKQQIGTTANACVGMTVEIYTKAHKCNPVGRTASRRARRRKGATRTKCACGVDDGAMVVAAVVVTAWTDKNNE